MLVVVVVLGDAVVVVAEAVPVAAAAAAVAAAAVPVAGVNLAIGAAEVVEALVAPPVLCPMPGRCSSCLIPAVRRLLLLSAGAQVPLHLLVVVCRRRTVERMSWMQRAKNLFGALLAVVELRRLRGRLPKRRWPRPVFSTRAHPRTIQTAVALRAGGPLVVRLMGVGLRLMGLLVVTPMGMGRLTAAPVAAARPAAAPAAAALEAATLTAARPLAVSRLEATRTVESLRESVLAALSAALGGVVWRVRGGRVPLPQRRQTWLA